MDEDGGVTLTLDAGAVEELPKPSKNPAVMSADPADGGVERAEQEAPPRVGAHLGQGLDEQRERGFALTAEHREVHLDPGEPA